MTSSGQAGASEVDKSLSEAHTKNWQSGMYLCRPVVVCMYYDSLPARTQRQTAAVLGEDGRKCKIFLAAMGKYVWIMQGEKQADATRARGKKARKARRVAASPDSSLPPARPALSRLFVVV